MQITMLPNGMLQIDGAKITYRNFSGTPSQFNRSGDRNFAIIIPDQETADALIDAGWNVKIKPAREEGDMPFMVLSVKVKFNERGPIAYLVTNGRKVRLDEESIGVLDQVLVSSADLDIRPYDWSVNGNSGRSAYLHAICATQVIEDRFADDFCDVDSPSF